MILGVGSDLIDIRRIEKTIERYGERFLDRIFTETERSRCDRRANRAASYARRFAAKEAASGQPGMLFTGGALVRLEAITPSGMAAYLALTITDEPPLAQAVVIITAELMVERTVV